MIGRPPSSTLFPNTTLCGSPVRPAGEIALAGGGEAEQVQRVPLPTVEAQAGDSPEHPLGHLVLDGPHRVLAEAERQIRVQGDRKSTRLNSSHQIISYAVSSL